MMMSPEAYYECYLKGKTPDQIMTCIRSLKKEIGHCKKQLERYETTTDPGPDVVLQVSRLYLERAKQALKEAGGEYIPSAKELAAEQLKKDFRNIYQFTFSIGGFFGGHHQYSLYPKKKPVYTVTRFPFDTEGQDDECLYWEEDFWTMLDEIHLEEWKHSYVDPYVCDGTQWELKVSFENGRRTMNWYGSNAYPPNFQKLKEFFGCYVDEDDEDEL